MKDRLQRSSKKCLFRRLKIQISEWMNVLQKISKKNSQNHVFEAKRLFDDLNSYKFKIAQSDKDFISKVSYSLPKSGEN